MELNEITEKLKTHLNEISDEEFGEKINEAQGDWYMNEIRLKEIKRRKQDISSNFHPVYRFVADSRYSYIYGMLCASSKRKIRIRLHQILKGRIWEYIKLHTKLKTRKRRDG